MQTPVPPGAQCPAGGVRVDTGLDLDSNGALDGSEVQSSAHVCSGAPGNTGASGQEGIDSLMAMEDVAAAPGCAGAGVRIPVGMDGNRNHQLDAAEVRSTRYLCQGARGNDGQNGANGTNGTNGSNGSNGQGCIHVFLRKARAAAGQGRWMLAGAPPWWGYCRPARRLKTRASKSISSEFRPTGQKA